MPSQMKTHDRDLEASRASLRDDASGKPSVSPDGGKTVVDGDGLSSGKTAHDPYDEDPPRSSNFSVQCAFLYASNPATFPRLKLMLEHHGNPNVVADNGESLLHYVIRKKFFELIEPLVAHGAHINAIDRNGMSLLDLYRSVGGNQKSQEKLLLGSADKKYSYEKAREAVRLGHFSEIRNLIAHGLDVNGFGDDGLTLLQYAVEVRAFSVARELLLLGADPDVSYGQNQSAIEMAVERGYGWVAGELAKFSKKEIYGRSLFARDATLIGGVNRLMAKGGVKDIKAGPTKSAKEEGQLLDEKLSKDIDPSHVLTNASFFIRQSRAEDLKRLLDSGLDPNACYSNGTSLLCDAIERNCAPIIELLLSEGADPHRSDKKGMSPVRMAQVLGRVDLAYRLFSIKPGASSSVKEEKLTVREPEHSIESSFKKVEEESIEKSPIEQAEFFIRMEQTADLKLLLEKGLDPNACLRNGSSLLVDAIEHPGTSMVDLLLSFGADPQRADANGITPLGKAQKLNRYDLSFKLFISLPREERMKRNAGAETQNTKKSSAVKKTAEVQPERSVDLPKMPERKSGAGVELKGSVALHSYAGIELARHELEDDDEDDDLIFGKPIQSKPVTKKPAPVGTLAAWDESDDDDSDVDDDFVSDLTDVPIRDEKVLVDDQTCSSSGLTWRNCIIRPEQLELAWEGISLLPIDINEKERFRRWSSGERPSKEEFFAHAEVAHALALYARSYVARRA